MAFHITDQGFAGHQAIATTSTTQNHVLGSIVHATDTSTSALGSGEFIYLSGVASTVVGSWVTYDYDDGTTVLLAANAIGPCAVAMSINVASSYGWYQIAGKASALTDNVADSADCYACSSAGVVDDAAVAGDRVYNAKTAAADTALSGATELRLSRPFTTDTT